MHARKNAVVAIIAGLATATAITGTAGSALATEKDKSARPEVAPAKVVHSGKASTTTKAKVPDAQLKAASKASAGRQAGVSASGSVGTAAATTSCYSYSNGTGDFCQWYLVNYTQSRGGLYYSDANFWDNYFVTAGWGQGQRIANNAESDYNYDRYLTARVATYTNYQGVLGDVRPRTGGNFTSTFKNNVESFRWV